MAAYQNRSDTPETLPDEDLLRHMTRSMPPTHGFNPPGTPSGRTSQQFAPPSRGSRFGRPQTTPNPPGGYFSSHGLTGTEPEISSDPELPSVGPRPISWADRRQSYARKATGRDEIQRLSAMLDFKESLVRQMTIKNQNLQGELAAEREVGEANAHRLALMELRLQEAEARAAEAEGFAAEAEARRAQAAQERDTAVALALQTQQLMDTETSKQQVAWDLGKQHALHVMMDVRRQQMATAAASIASRNSSASPAQSEPDLIQAQVLREHPPKSSSRKFAFGRSERSFTATRPTMIQHLR